MYNRGSGTMNCEVKMEKNNGCGESDLDRMALEEIIKETKRGKERAETMGPMGWVKCPLVPTNKRFFRNVVMGTLTDHKRSNSMKERKHQKERSPKNGGGRVTSDSPSSSHSWSQEGSIEKETKAKHERSKQSYSSSEYSNEATSSVQKHFDTKYTGRQSTRDNVTEKRSHDSISKKYDGEKPRAEKPHGEKPHGEKPHGEKPHGEKPHGEKPHGERNHSRKHKLLEKHKEEHKHHKHTKKRKEFEN